jgi:hypothetical protein
MAARVSGSAALVSVLAADRCRRGRNKINFNATVVPPGREVALCRDADRPPPLSDHRDSAGCPRDRPRRATLVRRTAVEVAAASRRCRRRRLEQQEYRITEAHRDAVVASSGKYPNARSDWTAWPSCVKTGRHDRVGRQRSDRPPQSRRHPPRNRRTESFSPRRTDPCSSWERSTSPSRPLVGGGESPSCNEFTGRRPRTATRR